MGDNSEHLVAATLTAAIVGRMEFSDVNEGLKETLRIYRVLSRRLQHIHDMEAQRNATELPC